MLEDIKVLLGITDDSKDDLLMLLINEAEEFIKIYTHKDYCDCLSILNQIVIFRYNTLSSIGLNSESYSGASFSYANDLPESIYAELRPIRKLRFV